VGEVVALQSKKERKNNPVAHRLKTAGQTWPRAYPLISCNAIPFLELAQDGIWGVTKVNTRWYYIGPPTKCAALKLGVRIHCISLHFPLFGYSYFETFNLFGKSKGSKQPA
jgi:hypothetical protein